MNAIKFSFFVIVVIFFNRNIVAQNVEITNTGNPSEPSIMMDPNNPNVLVAGSNLNFYYVSNDGGLNWNTNILKSPHGVWGDPVIDVDNSGNFYFTHLSNTPGGNWIDRIVCQKSVDNGKNWSDGTYAGLNGSKAQDKQWTVIDRTNNYIYMTWTEFDRYGSSNPSDKSRILFSKSIDQGETWTTPVKISSISGDCIDGDNTLEGAVPAVGPVGEVYVAWAGPHGIVFNRSTDQGDTWLAKEVSVASIPGGWNFDIPGISRANGLPITKCDLSGGPNHGTIYVNWTDQRNGLDNTDVWLCKSIDGGDTWSNPIRVNNDNSNRHQFFTWMDIDQINGNLYFIFYDRRVYTDNRTDVYLAISFDGGKSFNNRKISETPFIPETGIFFGDYNNIVAHNNIVRPIWTRLDTGRLSIWTDVSDLDSILNIQDKCVDLASSNVSLYPNPTNNMSYFSFKLHELSYVELRLIDENGRLIKTLIGRSKMEYGRHIIPIDIKKLKLASGLYYCRLSINNKSKLLKTIIVE